MVEEAQCARTRPALRICVRSSDADPLRLRIRVRALGPQFEAECQCSGAGQLESSPNFPAPLDGADSTLLAANYRAASTSVRHPWAVAAVSGKRLANSIGAGLRASTRASLVLIGAVRPVRIGES